MSETEGLLNEIKTYLRISAAADSRATAKSIIDGYEKAIVYSKLDGKISQTKLEAETKIPQQTISKWLAGFVQAGLVAPPDKYNPSHKALFTLQELAIDLGTFKKREKPSKVVAQQAPVSPTQTPTEPEQGVIQETLEREGSGTPNQ